jgi:hypothetical protein
MTYDDIIAGKAGDDVREVLLTEEQGWLALLKRADERHTASVREWQRIADEWRKRAEAK